MRTRYKLELNAFLPPHSRHFHVALRPHLGCDRRCPPERQILNPYHEFRNDHSWPQLARRYNRTRGQ